MLLMLCCISCWSKICAWTWLNWNPSLLSSPKYSIYGNVNADKWVQRRKSSPFWHFWTRNNYLQEKLQTKVLTLSPISSIPPLGLLVSESKHESQNKGRNLINLFGEFWLEKIKQTGVPLLAKAAASFVSSFHVVVGCTWVSDYPVSSNIQETLKNHQT